MLTPFYQALSGSLRARLMHGLSALVNHFMNSLYMSTRIHATGMLASLSHAPLELLATHMLGGFPVDTNPLG